MDSIDKETVLKYMKRHEGKRFTKNSLTEDLINEMGNKFSITFRVVDKWLEVLLASELIKSENAGKIKLFWYEGN